MLTHIYYLDFIQLFEMFKNVILTFFYTTIGKNLLYGLYNFNC